MGHCARSSVKMGENPGKTGETAHWGLFAEEFCRGAASDSLMRASRRTDGELFSVSSGNLCKTLS